MSDRNTGDSISHGKALIWANKSFPFKSQELVTNHPWAKVLRLVGDERVAYLKILPTVIACAKPSLSKVSELLVPDVPALISFDTTAGFFLYQDHGAKDLGRKPGLDTIRGVLTTYANLQVKAAGHADLIAALPSLAIEAQFDRLMVFLSVADTDPSDKTGPVTASHFLKSGTVERYQRIFASAADLFRKLLILRYDLPLTINHCDLRSRNAAQRPDGSFVMFDWDDAVSGPPGLSLHALFSGSTRPYQVPVVDLGLCFLMDCRLSHRGMANNSEGVRPITSLVYQRPWYRDPLNFQKQKSLDIDANTKGVD